MKKIFVGCVVVASLIGLLRCTPKLPGGGVFGATSTIPIKQLQAPANSGVALTTAGLWSPNAATCTSTQVLGCNGSNVPTFQSAGAVFGAATGLCSTGRPSATGTQGWFYCTDLPTVQYWDNPAGGGWVQFVSGQYTVAPAAVSGFTAANNIAAQQVADAWRIATVGTTTTTQIGDEVIAATLTQSTPYEIKLDADYFGNPLNGNNSELRLGIYNGTTSGTSTGTAIESLFVGGFYTYQTITLTLGTRGGVGAVGQTESTSNNPPPSPGRWHFRIINDGTNAHFQVGTNSALWLDWYTVATPAASAYAVGLGTATGGSYTQGYVYSLTESTTLGISQCTVTAATNATPIVLTVGAGCGAKSGDYVAVHGVTGNTNANTGTGNLTSGGVLVSVSGTSVTELGISGNGTFGGTSTLTVLSR